MLTPEKIASPCKNFCFLSAAPFCDPRDGREKVACVTFANYAGGALLLVDPAADTAESYHLPQDEGTELCRTALDTAPRSLAVSDGTVFCALPDRVALFDEATLAQEGSIPVSGCTKLLVSRKHGVLAFTESGTVYALSAAEKRAEPAGSAPAGVRAVCEAADGIYCAKTVELWRLDER